MQHRSRKFQRNNFTKPNKGKLQPGPGVGRRHPPPEHLPVYPYNMFAHMSRINEDESHSLSRDRSTTSSNPHRRPKDHKLLQIYYPKRLNLFPETSFDEPLHRRS